MWSRMQDHGNKNQISSRLDYGRFINITYQLTTNSSIEERSFLAEETSLLHNPEDAKLSCSILQLVCTTAGLRLDPADTA